MIRNVSIVFACFVGLVGCSDPPAKNGKSNGTNNSSNNGGSNNGGTNNGGTNNGGTNNGGTNNGVVDSVIDTNKLDLLFVIDNSGSMCQEQHILRENARDLFEELADAGVDFQLGITTTHMNGDYALEPLARPGELQAQPQPAPGFDRSCHTAVDNSGQPVSNDFSPIRNQIEIAVDCMEDPDSVYLAASDDDIRCALYSEPQGCTIEYAGCGQGSACTPEDLFPPADSYRALPKVLSSENYGGFANLDIANMVADFACMVSVGTRGYGIEQGLAAAVLAASPEMAEGPNAGLLREDAKFGLMFLTDENDCSHDGRLDETTPCAGDVCEFANAEDAVDSPLLAPDDLRDALMENLRDSKGVELGFGDVFVASLHGNSRRFSGEVPTTTECSADDYSGTPPSCATQLGTAFSGDRYERFLQSFPDGQYYPSEPIGWICTGDYRPALRAIGEELGSFVGP